MKKISAVIFSTLILSGCSGDARETLGMKIDAPDEFAVERKPRLDVPPSFKLRPPAPGEAALNSSERRDEAREKIIGSGISSSSASDAEKGLLKKAGVVESNPNIRAVLTQEAPAADDKDMIDRIREAAGGSDNVANTLVDPDKEKLRIDENIKNNKPINEGETPTMSENDGKSIVDKILN